MLIVLTHDVYSTAPTSGTGSYSGLEDEVAEMCLVSPLPACFNVTMATSSSRLSIRSSARQYCDIRDKKKKINKSSLKFMSAGLNTLLTIMLLIKRQESANS